MRAAILGNGEIVVDAAPELKSLAAPDCDAASRVTAPLVLVAWRRRSQILRTGGTHEDYCRPRR